ncbi:glycosyltransferase family 2 protein [Chryseobacterium echinoideorum]|uniref:glycosyltransferase family 2 protein n=1 Tax=Chryseobacterium echinoideorum TaxID=1549648 RepID=UPI001186732C|nr:glycosyltransferase family 2 protein [Chryseobacterium echinoideorum]
MKVSIITVCWNSEKYIETALESVLNQTYKDIEYIIVDGGSKDNTLDIIKEYEKKFAGRLHLISEKDQGIYDAMNKGIVLSSGDIIGILNSDDLYTSQYVIENIVKNFKNKNIDSLFSNLYYVYQDDINKIQRKWTTGLQDKFKNGWHPAHPTLFVKKEIYERWGVFDLKYSIAADFELMMRFFEKGKISSYYYPEYILKMRSGGTSNNNLKNILKGNKEVIDAFKKHNIKVPFYYTYKRWFIKAMQYF